MELMSMNGVDVDVRAVYVVRDGVIPRWQILTEEWHQYRFLDLIK